MCWYVCPHVRNSSSSSSAELFLVDWCFNIRPREQPSLSEQIYLLIYLFFLAALCSVHTRTECAMRGGVLVNCISWLHSPLEDTIVHQPYINQPLFFFFFFSSQLTSLINLTPLRLCGHAQSFAGGLYGRICKLQIPLMLHCELEEEAKWCAQSSGVVFNKL